MLGVKPGQLASWAKLGLIAPQKSADACGGESLYGFADLVAIETLKRLTAERIPAHRLKRSLTALRSKLGNDAASLDKLRITTNGRQVVVSSPETGNAAIEPLTGQMRCEFDASRIAEKIRALPSRTAEEWFEMGLAYDLKPATMRRAADAYRHAVRLAPEWVEAHIGILAPLFLFAPRRRSAPLVQNRARSRSAQRTCALQFRVCTRKYGESPRRDK